MLVIGKSASKSSTDKDAEDGTGTAYEKIEKDLNSLSKDEQMDVVYRFAFLRDVNIESFLCC